MFFFDNSLLSERLLKKIMPLSMFLICLWVAVGCTSSGKVPCPEIGGKPKFAMFHKKPDPTKPNEEGFGQSKRTEYNKNGLMKKKSYKSLKYKPKH